MSKKASWGSGIHKSVLADLPRDEFTTWEVSLHSELVRVLHEVCNPFPLEEWINSRLGHKIEMIHGANGAMICGEANYVLNVASNTDAAFDSLDTPSTLQPDAFFDLPPDKFTTEELALREAIFDYIAASGRREVVLADLMQDKHTQQRLAAFAQAVGLSTLKQSGLDKWLNLRIGEEIEIRGKQAKRTLTLKPAGEEYLRTRPRTNRHQTLTSLDSRPVVHETDAREDFFSRLSAESFTDAELALRGAIYKYLASVDQESDIPLPDVGADPCVTEKRKELAKENDCSNWKQIGLHDWIQNRMEAEMQVVRSKKPWTLQLTEVGRKEKFLAGLPKDFFTEDEERLRSVLISSVNIEMLSLEAVRCRPEVSACIEAVLPFGCPLSLEDWIKSRIASDINLAKMVAFERVGTRSLRTSAQHSEPTKDNIDEFVERFGLDANCEKLLRDLSWELQEDVMLNFNPKPVAISKGYVSALFTKFARTRSPRTSEPVTDNIDEFVARFGLDADCEKVLRDLSWELQEDIMRSFDPKPVAISKGYVSALFTKFAKTRSLRTSAQHTEPVTDNIDEFVARFGLDADCEKLLRDLSWELQEDIMLNFNPNPDIENVAALFTKFARARSRRTSVQDTEPTKDNIDEFVARFGLDADCEKLLRDLSWELQEDIIRSFDPKPVAISEGYVSALFTKFARTRSLRTSTQHTEPTKDNIDDFVERFGLDADCEKLLRDLSWELQEDIMRSFDPKPVAISEGYVSALFTKFAKTRSLPVQHMEPTKDNIDEFVERFGLDADCEKLLRDLSWELQEDVMLSFDPKPVAISKGYVSALFTKFARTRSLQSEADERPLKRTRW